MTSTNAGTCRSSLTRGLLQGWLDLFGLGDGASHSFHNRYGIHTIGIIVICPLSGLADLMLRQVFDQGEDS